MQSYEYFDITQILILKIYYFFMLTDGGFTPLQLDKFKSIYKSMETFELFSMLGGDKEDDIKKIISYCQNAVEGSDNKGTDIMIQILMIMDMTLDGFINNSKKLQIEIILNLLDLGYADKDCSQSELYIISTLADFFIMDEAVFADLKDTMETIHIINKQKESLKTIYKSRNEVAKRIRELDQTIDRMKRNLQLLIEEADIA